MKLITFWRACSFLSLPILATLAFSSFMFSCSSEKSSETTVKSGPHIFDDRLELTLFAENPDIVTPIGIAIDSLDRIFVLESHTHLPPSDYKGPDGDVVKIFADHNGDNRPDEIAVFAKGFDDGMNMTFSPEGHLYLVTARAVWILYDHNGDGVSEEQVKVIELAEPGSVYAHAALLGITFSDDGWMYISRGNTGSERWSMVGTDGSSLRGYGDGGNIVRARPDGTELQEVATGFWNPFDVKFDERGRLLAADNDPDSRGPNRLVHVVQGGDYGYQSLYGGSGIHPYLAWNGELPGTLPYVVGLGEAPSGLLDASLASLPQDYQGQMLGTIWEESRIVRINLSPKGVSIKGNTEVIIEGNQEFRPVAFATDSHGTIYFTDWVLRDYPNHGRGRIWKLSVRPDMGVKRPRKKYAPPLPNPEGEPLEEIYAASSLSDFEMLKDALKSSDPFLRHAAITVLSRSHYRQQAIEATRDSDADVRLGAMIALHLSGYQHAEPIARRLLDDPDARVRQRALMWIGQEGMTALQPALERALSADNTSSSLFETYLATVRHLMPEFIKAYQSQSEPYAKAIKRMLPPQFIISFIRDNSKPAVFRALAIRHLENPEEQIELLTSLLVGEYNSQLHLEVIRSLANIPSPETVHRLLNIATEVSNPVLVRGEALLVLTRQPVDVSAKVIPLLQDPDIDIQIEAARYLRTRLSSDSVRQALQQKHASLNKENQEPLRQQIALALSHETADGSVSGHPSSLEDWQAVLDTGGDSQRGRRVFYSVQSNCSLCHSVEGRGGDLGPDLTNVGLSKTRSQLVHAILRPSQEINPEWQGWYIKLKNGQVHQGRQIDVGGNAIDLYTQAEGFTTFDKEDIEEYGMIEKSLMPEGLEAQLTADDLRDLITFLESKK